jgi:hypothetical protein
MVKTIEVQKASLLAVHLFPYNHLHLSIFHWHFKRLFTPFLIQKEYHNNK